MPEAFQARVPVLVKSSPLVSSAEVRRSIGLWPTKLFVVREEKPLVPRVPHNRHLATTYLSVCHEVFNNANNFELYFSTRIFFFVLHKFILVFLDFRLLFLVRVFTFLSSAKLSRYFHILVSTLA